jgi:hypothetical protein
MFLCISHESNTNISTSFIDTLLVYFGKDSTPLGVTSSWQFVTPCLKNTNMTAMTTSGVGTTLTSFRLGPIMPGLDEMMMDVRD